MSQSNQKHLNSEDFLKPAINIALYYGFLPIKRVSNVALKVNEGPQKKKRKPQINRSAFDRYGAEHHTALQTYLDHQFDKLPNPVLFFQTSEQKKTEETTLLTLQSLGGSKSISEALVIKSALDILNEVGVGDICVHINTTGDKDSTIRYKKALNVYLRKHMNSMPTAAQSALKKDVFLCLSYLYKKEHPIYDDAPQSMEFLSEPSRRHMRELLEYFEITDVPYIIDKGLVEYSNYCPKTMFEIRSMCDSDYDKDGCKEIRTYARGCRYDDLSKRVFRTDIPATSISFEYIKNSKNHSAIVNPKSIRKPKIHFIQFGFDAKLKSLTVIDMLRKAKMPIHQSLGNDRLSRQLEIAEQMKIPYTIIMGQKEVLDDTVIIRNMQTRAQNIVPIANLPEYIKDIRL